MERFFDNNALRIVKNLERCGYKAYLVGGCVRDAMLHRIPNDHDICTNARPEDIIRIFGENNTIPTGLKHGTVTVKFNGGLYEVTTFRQESDYKDGRHPDSVEFVQDVVFDLCRRDFTINAMAYNPQTGLMDLFGGKKDLEDGIVRCVGAPAMRFAEDALRILRMVRFAARYNFDIAPDTQEAANKYASELRKVSKERITDELVKILMAPQPAIYIKNNKEIFFTILPELRAMDGCEQNTPYHEYDVFDHTLTSLTNIEFDLFEDEFSTSHVFSDDEKLIILLSVLFHDVAKPHCKTTDENGVDHFYTHAVKSSQLASDIMRKRLRLPNKITETVELLIKYHDLKYYAHEYDELETRQLLSKFGLENLRLLIAVRLADLVGHGSGAKNYTETLSAYYKTKYFIRIIAKVAEEKPALTVKDLKVSGNDIIALGEAPGPQVGFYLSELLDLVIENPELNEREFLLDKVKDWRKTFEHIAQKGRELFDEPKENAE